MESSSWPGIEPGPAPLGGQNLSHWTTREVSECFLFWITYFPTLFRNTVTFLKKKLFFSRVSSIGYVLLNVNFNLDFSSSGPLLNDLLINWFCCGQWLLSSCKACIPRGHTIHGRVGSKRCPSHYPVSHTETGEGSLLTSSCIRKNPFIHDLDEGSLLVCSFVADKKVGKTERIQSASTRIE